jgi:hypothetical protein
VWLLPSGTYIRLEDLAAEDISAQFTSHDCDRARLHPLIFLMESKKVRIKGQNKSS